MSTSSTYTAAELSPGEWFFEGTEEDQNDRSAGMVYRRLDHVSPNAISVLVEADWATDADLLLMAASKKMLEALRAIEAHHICLNERAGRPIGQSNTIRLARAAIAAATTYPRGETS